MKVAYDAGPLLGTPTGVGRYACELAGALEARGVTLQRYAVSLKAPAAGNVARWRIPARLAQNAWMRLGRPVPHRLLDGADLVHATNFVLPPTGPRPGVVTIHDLSFDRADVFPGGERLRELVPWSLQRAAKVIVPTEAVATELADRYGHTSERIAVTPEGVSPRFFGATPLADSALAHMGIPGPFVLAVGTLEPRKNLHRLVEAWRSIRSQLQEWRLVVAGPTGWGPELPKTEGMMLLGYVGDETLPGLMAAADVFCYPSHYEGFGLPPLEAMAAGTACVVGRYSAAEEVLGDAALLVEPDDAEALAQAVVSVAEDEPLRRRMSLMAKSRAAAYTWERTASLTVEVYDSVLSD